MNEATMLYGGLDLHGNNVYCALVDCARQVVYEKRLPNEMEVISDALAPYRTRIAALAVESTFNWYWLVDGLRGLKYDVRLANPTRMQENLGLKMASDKTDARFIARQLANGILPEGFIYPVETRGVRDLLRRRMRLVDARTAEWLSLESLVARHTGKDLGMKELKEAEIGELLSGKPHAYALAQISLRHVEFLNQEINALEKAVMKDLPDREDYQRLMTVPGIGLVLARVILLETGPISRFRSAGNYASYCRAVKSEHTSNNKKKGKCNGKNGNKYLGWAFVEASNFAVRHSPELRAWFQRKLHSSDKRVVAVKALSNKLSKACFFILRDKVDFDVKRLIG